MTLAPIRVECYAAGRGDERPRRLTIENVVYVVAGVLAESVEESFPTRGRVRRFKILTEEGLVLEVVRMSDGNWYLMS